MKQSTSTDRLEPFDLGLINLPQVCQQLDFFLFLLHQLLHSIVSAFQIACEAIENETNNKRCHGSQGPKEPISRYHCD